MPATAMPARQTQQEFNAAFALMVEEQFAFAQRVHEEAEAAGDPIRDPDDLMDRMSGRVADLIKNPCGECNLCCVAPSIPADQIEDNLIPAKRAGEACVHCTVKGCAIYDRRPSLCKGYACLYALGVTTERPDRTGIAWTITPVHRQGEEVGAAMIGHCLDIDEAMDVVSTRDTIRHGLAIPFLKGVTVRGSREACVFLPGGETLEAHVNPEEALLRARVTEQFTSTDKWENPILSSFIREENVTRFANNLPSF